MIRLLIADDDTIVRTSIKTMVEWEREGVRIVAEAANGRQALEILESEPVDVLLTDIRMPLMDGLALLERLSRLPNPPASVVLSAYDEFPFVRRAFTLGAADYLLKAEMTPAGLLKCVKETGAKARQPSAPAAAGFAPTPSQRFREAALSLGGLQEVLSIPCVLACFELDDYPQVQRRFGSGLEQDLAGPLCDLAGQIHRVASDGVFCSLSPSRYLLGLRIPPETDAQAASHTAAELCRQITRAWKVYMNLSASVGLSSLVAQAEALEDSLQECLRHASMRVVLGPGQIITAARYAEFDLPSALASAQALSPLLDALKSGNDLLLNETRTQLFAPLFHQPVERAHQLALAVVYHAGLFLSGLGASLSRVFGGEEFRYAHRVRRFETVPECELWTANFLRFLADFLAGELHFSQADVMDQARRFLLDQYQNPLLSVRLVADAVGLSEKYFSTRFNKTFGTSVSAFVNSLRVAKAKELLQRADLKVYEIAETVGFRNTEHFIRVFSRQVGVPPSVYKKSTSNERSINRT